MGIQFAGLVRPRTAASPARFFRLLFSSSCFRPRPRTGRGLPSLLTRSFRWHALNRTPVRTPPPCPHPSLPWPPQSVGPLFCCFCGRTRHPSLRPNQQKSDRQRDSEVEREKQKTKSQGREQAGERPKSCGRIQFERSALIGFVSFSSPPSLAPLSAFPFFTAFSPPFVCWN